MNPIDPNEKPDSLHRLLGEWEVQTPLPSRFEGKVWGRIKQADALRGPGLFAWLGARMEVTLLRPAVAYAYVMALLIAGSAFGWSQAQKASAQQDQSLGRRYVRAIDPYQRLR